MKTSQFLKILLANPTKELVFEYRPGQYVPKAFHITEVKNLFIESVDCGGNPSSDRQTVVQLWATDSEKADRAMDAAKATKIFGIVESKKPLTADAQILFEYGNETTPTSVYDIEEVAEENDQLLIQLYVPPTQCKPRELLKKMAQEGSCCEPETAICCG